MPGRDYRALDLGIGSDDYKRLFCKSDEPIFDSFIPLSQRGKLAAGVDVGPQPHQAAGEAQSGAAADGAKTAQRVQLNSDHDAEAGNGAFRRCRPSAPIHLEMRGDLPRYPKSIALQAATTRGPGSTASDGWHGLLSIVTSEKPTAFS